MKRWSGLWLHLDVQLKRVSLCQPGLIKWMASASRAQLNAVWTICGAIMLWVMPFPQGHETSTRGDGWEADR
jgi:hypothetical protein